VKINILVKFDAETTTKSLEQKHVYIMVLKTKTKNHLHVHIDNSASHHVIKKGRLTLLKKLFTMECKLSFTSLKNSRLKLAYIVL